MDFKSECPCNHLYLHSPHRDFCPHGSGLPGSGLHKNGSPTGCALPRLASLAARDCCQVTDAAVCGSSLRLPTLLH